MVVDVALIDLDGTLWDSAPWYAELLSEHPDYKDVAAIAEKLSGPSSGLNVARELQRVGYSKGAYGRACRDRGHRLRIFDGAEKALREASEVVALGVVTNLPRWMAVPMLDTSGLGDLFSVVQGAAYGVRPKPSPSGINRAIAMFPNVDDASSVLYVGDTSADADAAGAAGARFLWARWGYDDLDGVDVLTNWTELGSWL